MMKKRTPASFRTLIAELSKDAKLPYWISVLVHIISNLQITYIIFQPTMNPLYDINLRVLKTLRIIGSYTVGFNIFDPPTDQTGLAVGWIITCAYLLILATISNIILLRCYFRQKVDPHLAQVMGIVHFIHSKIIFCPIHYFLVWFASSYSDCASGSTDTVCKFPFFIISLVFIILNVAFSVIAELFPRESKKPKDAFAMKNCILYQTILCHKIVLIIFELNIQDSKFVLSIFNFLVTLVYCYNILSSLPFYNIPILKLNIIMSSTHFSFSLMLMIILFGVRPGYLEALSVILVVYVTKIFLAYLNKTLTRILGLGFRNPQEAAHCLVLLKDYTARYANVTKLGEKYQRGSIYLHGLLKLYKVDTTTLAEFGTMGQYDLQLYGVVVRKLNELAKVYPKSEILTLLIAQVYIKKLRNASKAIALLTEFEANGASDHALRSIKQIYLNLEKIYRKVHTDKELELLKYFMHRDNANKLKDMVQEEVIKHITLWKELSGDVIDVKSVSDLAEGIDRLAIALNKNWNEYQKNFDKNFITPMLMVGAYHDIVRKNAHSARQTLRKYDELRKNKSALKDETSPFSEDIAILLGSIESDNPGVITDASASVQDLFHITREKLIGQKIDVLLPRIVAKKHDGFIKRYNQESRYDLDTKFDTYIRTIEGHYYPVDVKLKVYPFVSQGLNIISHIKKLRERDLLIIIDPKGVVADCSEDLYDVLNLSKKDLDNCKASDLCPELREVDYALNYLYGVSKEYISQYKDESKIITSDDKLDLLKEKSEESKHEDEDGEEKEQEQEVEFAKETDEKLAKVSSGLQTLSEKPKLMPAKTMSSHYSPFSQQTSQVHSAARQNADEVVKKFKKGVKTTFFPRGTARDRHNSAPLDKIEFKIVVVPYTLNGELYKIVKFKNVYFEQNQNPVGLEVPGMQEEAQEDEADVSERYDIKLSAKITAQLSPEPSQDEFAENFPSAKERSFEGHTTDFVEEKVVNIPRKTNIVKNAKPAKAARGQTKLEKLQSIFIHHLDEDSFNRSFTKEDQLQFRLYAKGVADDTSSLNYSHKETRIVKALNDLFQKANLRPLTRITVFIVYFAMFAVLVLASVDFVYSSRSFTQMKDGVAIVDSASYRIWNSIVAWQYILILYARSVNLRPLASNPGIVTTSNNKINTSTIAMLQNSADLQNLIQNSGETDIINTFFDNDINLWLPNQAQTVIGKGSVDSFTAYRVIAQKNIFICNYDQSILLLNGNEDVLFTMNNTVNNLLIRSEDQVSTTEGIVNSIINTNQSLIVVLLTLEMISLGFVVFSLFLVARVIILAYQKLFRVITRIHPENFAHRISELEHVRECLNKNMEARDFTIRVEAASDMTVKQPTKKTGGKQRAHNRFREDKFVTKGLVIFTFKFCFIGVILVLGIAGIFLLSFFTADSTFTTLERKNSRLSLTHKLGYTFDMILGNFYYTIIFQNSSKFLMRFNPAGEELDNNLAYLAAANQNLLDVLPDPGKGITDPIIEDFTKNDICKYLNSSLASACDLVTQGGTLGLFGINSKYYADTENFVYLYKQTPTFDYASNLLVNYSATITNSLNVVPAAYQFLRLYLLDDFNNRVTQQNNEGKVIFVIVLVSLAVATLVIQLITIRKFKEIDVGIRKILKIIPFPIIQENRLFGFYLKTEFAKELDSIKQFV